MRMLLKPRSRGPAALSIVVLLAFASYAIMRALAGAHDYDERKDLAGSVIFRVSALHGLILALVFAQEIANLNEADRTAARRDDGSGGA